MRQARWHRLNSAECHRIGTTFALRSLTAPKPTCNALRGTADPAFRQFATAEVAQREIPPIIIQTYAADISGGFHYDNETTVAGERSEPALRDEIEMPGSVDMWPIS